MKTFADQVREIKPVGLGKKRAIQMPLMAATIESNVVNQGYQEAEQFDIVVTIGQHSQLIYPNDARAMRPEVVRNAQKSIMSLVYRDVHHGLHQLRALIGQVNDHKLRYEMETAVSDIFAKTEIA